MNLTPTDFSNEINFLRSLNSNDLYREFHKIQSAVLAQQNERHVEQIVKDWTPDKVQEIFGPKSPEIPEQNSNNVLSEIRHSKGKEHLLLQHVLSFVDNPIEILAMAKECGFKKVIIHDSPKDGRFKYESNPEIDFFAKRHLSEYAKHICGGNPAIDKILSDCHLVGYKIVADHVFDFNYVSQFEKLSLVKMEIAYDLIENKFAGLASMHDQIKSQLETWFFEPNSWLKVMGCSRWLVLDTL
jgi:hypothetical protein